MMDRKLCIPGLAGIMSLILIGLLPGLREPELMAQAGPESPETVTTDRNLSRPSDPLRECRNRDDQPEATDSDPIFYDQSWGNNPQEGQYRLEMERLLRLEIDEVKKAIEDIQKKHSELVILYPRFKNYQEIVLEDVPGTWRGGQYVNSKKMIIFHYREEGETKQLDCVVLESMERNVYNPNQFTRKIMRLYYPNIQTLELETRRHNYVNKGTLDRASTEVQLNALRLVFRSLRTALYSMDMLIAAHYDRRNRKNFWQIDL